MNNNRSTAIAQKLKERSLKFSDPLKLFNYHTHVRKIEEIAKRAVVSAIVSKCAYDLFETNDKQKTKEKYAEILNNFNLQEELFVSEKEVLFGDFDEQLCIKVGWQYEATIALLWALGMVESIDDADHPDDIATAIDDVLGKITAFNSFDNFLRQCVLRGEEELADAYQLYWHYHWNVVDGMLFGTIPQSISYDVVYERRRALQWLTYSEESEEGEWDFPMDT